MERNDMILYFDIPEFSESLYCPWWKPGYVIPQAGDNIRLENLLPEEQLALLELVPVREIWADMEKCDQTMRWMVEHGLFRVVERGFSLRKDGKLCCSLRLQRYSMPRAARRTERTEKIRFYFRKYFVHVDVPNTLPQYPEVREYVHIKPLLSETDRKLLAETECDEAENLLDWIEEEGYCRVRARCWRQDEESGEWLCVLSVDV